MRDNYPRINRGKRTLIAGRTGSGKSALCNWLLNRSTGHWIILNPKWTKAYSQLPDSTTVSGIDYKKIEREIQKFRFVIVEPKSGEADKEDLDNFIMWLHDSYSNVGLCVDELYTLHANGRAGPGLIGWLTRGRELGQSFIGLTQRPAWLSQFLFSESDYICSMSLALESDRKRMVEMTGQKEFSKLIPPYHWTWYDTAKMKIRKFGPVPLTSNKR